MPFGKWKLVIEGEGHYNERDAQDVDQVVAHTLGALRGAGHRIGQALLYAGPVGEAPPQDLTDRAPIMEVVAAPTDIAPAAKVRSTKAKATKPRTRR